MNRCGLGGYGNSSPSPSPSQDQLTQVRKSKSICDHKFIFNANKFHYVYNTMLPHVRNAKKPSS